jgi:transcriptional regulator with XRE-family HTH domain
MDQSYAQKVGERLRGIRRQKRLSLQDVEAASGEEFKASVLGAYERGERSISVPRLQRLAQFYEVPVDQLLPQMARIALPRTPAPSTGGVTIDLSKLGNLSDPELDILERFLTSIQMQRQDFNGRMLTIRREDLRVLACLFDLTPDTLSERLDAMGLKVSEARVS